MTEPIRLPPAPQLDLATQPYDRWLDPDGGLIAEFHRRDGGFLLRFPGTADFEIDAADHAVRARPVDAGAAAHAETLLRNAIAPVIANHRGELNLHGSAVRVSEGRAAAFLGLSRRGKTTLAGAFARAGQPFLTEDVIRLERTGNGFLVHPSRPELRLFPDSAAYLLGHDPANAQDGAKAPIDAGQAIAFHDEPVPLCGIFVLGPGTAGEATIERLSESAALPALLPHSFLLDVEDRRRLKEHFLRLAVLTRDVPCYALDYPRLYDQLPKVIRRVTRLLEIAGCPDADG